MFFSKKKFSVDILGRGCLRYSEGNKIILLEAELLVGDIDFVIYSFEKSRWQPPYDQEILTDRDYERIKSNIISDFSSNNMTVEWN